MNNYNAYQTDFISSPFHTRRCNALHACPCGYYGDLLKLCTCSSAIVTKYQKRISGPLLDRIDIHIEVPRVEYDKLSEDRLGAPSSVYNPYCFGCLCLKERENGQ